MIFNISSNSFLLKTLPVGLLGEFKMINFVLDVILDFSLLISILKPFSAEVSRIIGFPPASLTI